ncbi:hypothetical protein ACXU4B_03695 [Dyella soli]
MCTAFQLADFERESLIAEHRFYVEQARTRLLSQFANIEAEAELAEQEHWDRSGESFDPERHDPGDLAEAARDHGVQFYQLLGDMHDRTRLSVVAGMYHHWDKSFRRFLIRELRWPRLVIGDHTRRTLWKLDSIKLELFLRALGLDVRKFASFPRLDAMRLVVNVFKHGEGPSLDDLRQNYPEFLRKQTYAWGFSDDTDMLVSDEQVDTFAAAIETFWQELPSELTFEEDSELDVPKDFEKAWHKDQA